MCASRILSLRPANLLDEQLVSNIMFAKENTKFLHKHYSGLARAETDPSLHFLVDLEMEYLPPLPNEDKTLMWGRMIICWYHIIKVAELENHWM